MTSSGRPAANPEARSCFRSHALRIGDIGHITTARGSHNMTSAGTLSLRQINATSLVTLGNPFCGHRRLLASNLNLEHTQNVLRAPPSMNAPLQSPSRMHSARQACASQVCQPSGPTLLLHNDNAEVHRDVSCGVQCTGHVCWGVGLVWFGLIWQAPGP